jgi:hypothetical protein
MLLLTVKRQDFIHIFLLKSCAKYRLNPVLDLDPPEPAQEHFRSTVGRGTGISINHYGSTTLLSETTVHFGILQYAKSCAKMGLARQQEKSTVSSLGLATYLD